MVGTSRRSRKSAGTLFVPLPGDQESRLQELLEQLPADHLARQIVQAVNRLDLSEFLASYHGRGSLPYRPKSVWANCKCAISRNGRVNAKPQIRSLSAFPILKQRWDATRRKSSVPTRTPPGLCWLEPAETFEYRGSGVA